MDNPSSQANELNKAEDALTSIIEITGKTLLAASTADPKEVQSINTLSDEFLVNVQTVYTALSQTIQKVAQLNAIPIVPSSTNTSTLAGENITNSDRTVASNMNTSTTSLTTTTSTVSSTIHPDAMNIEE